MAPLPGCRDQWQTRRLDEGDVVQEQLVRALVTGVLSPCERPDLHPSTVRASPVLACAHERGALA
jgi:hypothetical protein